MKKFKIAVSFFLIIFPGMAMAQAPAGFSVVTNAKIIKEGVKQASANTFSLSSDFVQEKHLTMMDEVLVSKGLFLFKKDNNVKWEYVSPIHYAILIRGNHFVINNDGKISEFDTGSNKLFKEINNMIVMAIRGNFVDNPDFTASFYESRSFYLVSLSPNNEQLKGILQSIDIYFDKTDFGVRKVKFVEPGKDFTLIEFKNRKTNIEIPDTQFKVEHD